VTGGRRSTSSSSQAEPRVSAPSDRVAAFAPGRVNLIGEHTDYNDGLCLPFAIELGVTVRAEPLRGTTIEARALDFGEEDRFGLDDRSPAAGWRAFVRGAAAELRAAGTELRPARLEIAGDVPLGAGLSSSAAFCVALCLGLCAVAGASPPGRLELARLCSRVENEWVGARTGLLDQLASLFGERGRAIRIDMRSLAVAPVPLELGGHRLATLDSGTQREVSASGYNERRAECAAAREALGLGSLRDACPEDARRLPEPLGRRLRHVVSENGRVEGMVEALDRGEPERAGRLLDASHRSLRDDYDVSVPAVESTVEQARAAGAVGARMVGGGFGGHVLALFPPGVELPAGARPVAPGPGARLL
jgi:galactokinase